MSYKDTRGAIWAARHALHSRPLRFGDHEQIRALELLERVAALRELLREAGLSHKTIERVIDDANEADLRRLEVSFS